MNKFNLPENIRSVEIGQAYFAPDDADSSNDPFAIFIREANTDSGMMIGRRWLLPRTNGIGAIPQSNTVIAEDIGVDLAKAPAPRWFKAN